MRVDQAKRLKKPEKENVRLKKLVADLSLDNAIIVDELLNGEISDTLLEASVVIERWRKEHGGTGLTAL